ncbi:MAG: YjbQ family protein [Alphaproteobacteria bacterium]|nr:YjbQ family protein [Alphaproteobacteria bacterium]
MRLHRHTLRLPPRRRGLHEITDAVAAVVAEAGVSTGLCHLFLLHTSASLLVQENADPAVLHDLEAWFAEAAPDGSPRWRHSDEGPDDMPAHLRTALTQTSITLPVDEGRLLLGTWQGLYLFEHRLEPHARRLVATVWGPSPEAA